MRFDVDESNTISTPSFDEDALRRRTVKQLARKHKTDNPGCSPSVFLTLLGLVICTVTLIVGIVVFNVQWRRYGVLWGGYLEWNCTLVSCHLRYSYTGTYRAMGLRNFMVRSAKKFGNKFAGEQWEPVETWIQDFTNGKPESFPPLSKLPLCTGPATFQSWLFGGLCEASSRYTKLIGGTIWGVICQASRIGFVLVLLSILLSSVVFVFVVVEHQVCRKDWKPRWAVAAVKTEKFRPVAKVAVGLCPICTAACVLQYRISIAGLEQSGGVCKVAFSFLAEESVEVQMPWGTLWYCVIAVVQLGLTIGLLRGPLRKPEAPLAMDLVDIQVEMQRRHFEEESVHPVQPYGAPGHPGHPGHSGPGPGPGYPSGFPVPGQQPMYRPQPMGPMAPMAPMAFPAKGTGKGGKGFIPPRPPPAVMPTPRWWGPGYPGSRGPSRAF